MGVALVHSRSSYICPMEARHAASRDDCGSAAVAVKTVAHWTTANTTMMRKREPARPRAFKGVYGV